MADGAREIHLLLADPGERLLVQRSPRPALPSLTIDLPPGITTVQGTIAALRDRFGITSPLLEIHFDYAHDEATGPVPVLTTLEPDDAFDLPDGFAWRPLAGPDPATHPGLRPRLEELLAEWRTRAPPPALRPRWARPGWYARASAWLTARLEELDRPPTGPIEQVRHWGISAMLRAPTAGGAVWLKAVFPPFHHEPGVTARLAEEFPDLVPTVVAIDADEGWLALEDLGSATVREAEDGAGRAEAPGLLATIQAAFVGRTGELAALGAPERPLDRLAPGLAALLGEEPRLTGVTLDAGTGVRAVERVEAAARRLAGLELPATLVHGDFHGGNVALTAGRPVIFDWSDAAISNPLVDVITWIARDDPPDRRAVKWRAFVEAWAAPSRPHGRLEAALPDVLAAGAGYQALSYAGIVRNIEPLRRPENADGLEHFLELITEPPDPSRGPSRG